jgi:hypothetical protein
VQECFEGGLACRAGEQADVEAAVAVAVAVAVVGLANLPEHGTTDRDLVEVGRGRVAGLEVVAEPAALVSVAGSCLGFEGSEAVDRHSCCEVLHW